MENRFGVKDFVLFLLLIVLIISVWLAMKQYDRQWTEIRSLSAKVDAQGTDVYAIKKSIDEGGINLTTTRPGGGTPTTLSSADPFARVRAARALPGFTAGDWFVEGFGGSVAKISPLLSGDTYGSQIQGNVLETLLQRDPVTLEWSGLIAESWKIDDNVAAWDAYVAKRKTVPITKEEVLTEPAAPPADKPAERAAYVEARLKEGRTEELIGHEPTCPPALSIRFQLRPNVSFSDGTRLSADDVVFTYQFIMNPEVNAPRERSVFDRIKGVVKEGDLAVRYDFAVPYFESLELAGSTQVLAKHFYDAYKPSEYNETVGTLFGSGPYKMENPKDWKPGALIQLVRNDRYWGLGPAFNRMVFREYTSDVPRLTAFRNGEIDRLSAFPEQYDELKRDDQLAARTMRFEYLNPVGGYRYVAWNQKRNGKPTVFADRRVRQAMTMLIDRQRLIDDVMLGYGVIATGPFNPQSKQYEPGLQPYPHDPARAKQLLQEAGCKVDAAGKILKPDGSPFSFKLTYPSGNPNYQKMVFLFKDSFADAGVTLEPDPLEWAVFTTRLANKDFDAITLAWSAGIETDIFQMFHSSQAAAGGDNFISYISPELDSAITQARRTLDEGARMTLWNRAHQILHDDQPYTFLVFPKTLLFMQNRFQNVQKLPLGLNGNEEWFVPANLQKWKE